MKIALVDDEQHCLAEMEALCCDYQKKSGYHHMELFTFLSGEAFVHALESTSFSIVFLDIYMGGTDGIAAARKLREKDPACVLIFLTSSADFMPEAFSCHAFEYVSKPINRQRIGQVLDDAMKILPLTREFIELVCDRKSVKVFLEDIIFAVTDAHYLELSMLDGTTLRTRMTVKEFLHLTGQAPCFVLANRGVLLNAVHIRSFGAGYCVMENGAKLPMRVKDAGRVEQAVRDYNFEMIRCRQNLTQGGR